MTVSDDEFPLLPALGLYASDIRGDGNCLFNALSDQLYGHQGETHAIRAKVIQYMREHADDYKYFVDVYPGGGTRRNPRRKGTAAKVRSDAFQAPSQADIDRVFENHLQAMAQGGTYGDNMEITAFSRAFNFDVKIYQRDVALMVSGGLDSPHGVAHIAYHTWEHYSSIRNISGPHTGLPMVNERALSPETQARQQQKLSDCSYVLPWMIDVVQASLPHLADRLTVKQALEQCKGSVDSAVSMLLDRADSTTSSTSSSVHEGSGFEKDGGQSGVASQRPRRRLHTRRDMERALGNLSQDSGIGTDSDVSTDPSSTGGAYSTEVVSILRHPSLSSETTSRPGTPKIRLVANRRQDRCASPSKNVIMRSGPQRITARERKEANKRAQKMARKERAKGGQVSPDVLQVGAELRQRTLTNTPPIESGLRTLFI